MYQVSEQFRERLENGEIQHIFGIMTFKNSYETIYLDDDVIVGSPSFSRQCTHNQSVFGIGELYTGTCRITLNLPDKKRDELRGASILLEFGVGNNGAGSETIPLGTWTVTDPQRTSDGCIELTATDAVGQLDVPMNSNYVGAITMENRLRRITDLTGVRFAQTPEEIYELIGGRNVYFAAQYCETARAEVAAIAEFMGGFACADRMGKIVFKKFGRTPVRRIEADKRHSIRLAEYNFGIRGISYTNKYGQTTLIPINTDEPEPNTAVMVTMVQNPYCNIWADDENIDWQTAETLEPACRSLTLPNWTPGELDFYGDPTLDLGDMVEVVGGINGSESTLFLITGENWQFRGAQTLISAGAVDGVTPSFSAPSISQTQQIVVRMNNTKTLEAVELETTAELLTDRLHEVAFGAYSARDPAVVFVSVNAEILGRAPSEVVFHVLHDGVRQTVRGVQKVTSDGLFTLHFQLHISASEGSHTVTVEAMGDGEIVALNAVVWGQGIVGEQYEPAVSSDYEYVIDKGEAMITRYIGNSKIVTIPDRLEGVPVRTLGAESFTNSAVRSVRIPSGIKEIR